MLRKPWPSGGQWGTPPSDDGHLTAETETERREKMTIVGFKNSTFKLFRKR